MFKCNLSAKTKLTWGDATGGPSSLLVLWRRRKALRWLGIEPRSTAWKAAMLATIPPSLRKMVFTANSSIFLGIETETSPAFKKCMGLHWCGWLASGTCEMIHCVCISHVIEVSVNAAFAAWIERSIGVCLLNSVRNPPTLRTAGVRRRDNGADPVFGPNRRRLEWQNLRTFIRLCTQLFSHMQSYSPKHVKRWCVKSVEFPFTFKWQVSVTSTYLFSILYQSQYQKLGFIDWQS